jgi:hypothetical protein
MSENALQTNTPWNIYKKISFRFFFLLLPLFIILNNNGAFPFLSGVLQLPSLVLHDLIPWFSKHIIHYNYDFTIYTNGSGDTSYDWVLLLFIFFVSVIGCIIWSVLDRKRKSYNAAYYWLVVLVRFYLGFNLNIIRFNKSNQASISRPFAKQAFTAFWRCLAYGSGMDISGLFERLQYFYGPCRSFCRFIIVPQNGSNWCFSITGGNGTCNVDELFFRCACKTTLYRTCGDEPFYSGTPFSKTLPLLHQI